MARPKKELPANFLIYCQEYNQGFYTFKELSFITGIPKTRLCVLLSKHGFKKPKKLVDNRGETTKFRVNVYRQFYKKKITSSEVSGLLDKSTQEWYPKYKDWLRRMKNEGKVL